MSVTRKRKLKEQGSRTRQQCCEHSLNLQLFCYINLQLCFEPVLRRRAQRRSADVNERITSKQYIPKDGDYSKNRVKSPKFK